LFEPVQIDINTTKRDSKWILICPKCQYEREGSYCQARNIINKKSSGKCKKCANVNNGKNSRFQKGTTPWNKGKKHKIDRSYDKNKKQMETVNAFGGLVFTQEIKNKMSNKKKGLRGDQCNNWQDGISIVNRKERAKKETRIWRKLVLKRDNDTCQECGNKENLHAHHIKKWSDYPDLRHDVTNGITLCKDCHINKHKRGSNGIQI
jgi:5-methylcytosine-specific restriction endonuclease McrA